MTTPTRPVIIKHLIGGRSVGSPHHEHEDPALPGIVVSVAPTGTPEDIDEAVAAAAAAAPGWAATPPPGRGAILARAAELLARRADEVANDLCAEEGKTLAEARGEVMRAADILRFHAGTGWRLGGETFPSAIRNTVILTARQPLGVVGLITPWNFPIAIPAWKVAPALVAGNTVVLKPAELTPASARHLAECLVEAGLPDGALNVVFGSGGTAGRRLVEHPDVSAISFTGSGEVGRGIERTLVERHARVQLEMGGKNATVVLADADPTLAARLIGLSAFGLTGQACTATSRVIVEHPLADALIDALRREADAYQPGDGRDEKTRMGPVVSPEQLATDMSYIEIAREEGAELAFGGSAEAQFLKPTLFTGVERSMRVAREEVFGPVVALFTVDDLDEAISVTNDSAFGLTAGIVTNQLAAAMKFSHEVEAGVIKVNRPTTGLDLNVPFGGIKDSSTATFREQGTRAVEFYTRERSIYLGT